MTMEGKHMSNLIECATCGYPLAPEERTTLVEVNGKMRKPWVGLTDEQIEEIAARTLFPVSFARAIESKLKAKNERKEKNT